MQKEQKMSWLEKALNELREIAGKEYVLDRSMR